MASRFQCEKGSLWLSKGSIRSWSSHWQSVGRLCIRDSVTVLKCTVYADGPADIVFSPQSTHINNKSEIPQKHLPTRNGPLHRTSKTSIITPPRAMNDYVHLLRQRRQHKKLDIIQQALTNLHDTEPNPSRVDIKAFLKEELGEPPQAPIPAIDQNDAQTRVDELTFRLEKELLIAKSRLNEANKAKDEAEKRVAALPAPSLAAKVAALRSARDHMIDWVEGELAKIPESDGDTSQADLSFMDETLGSEELSDEEVTAKVQELYSVYITARERLIANVDATTKLKNNAISDDPLPPDPRSPAKGPTTPSKPIRASDILPYLRTLLHSSREEASLLQQTSHLRRQLTLATEETDRAVQRLAGESYLVPQDTIRMDAWAKAANEATAKTDSFVKAQIEAGDESVANARKVLTTLEARKTALQSMKGDL
jgi:hypothetical protein